MQKPLKQNEMPPAVLVRMMYRHKLYLTDEERRRIAQTHVQLKDSTKALSDFQTTVTMGKLRNSNYSQYP